MNNTIQTNLDQSYARLLPTSTAVSPEVLQSIHFSTSGEIYLCDNFVSRFVQWIKDFLWDDTMTSASSVFQACTVEYFATKSKPITTGYTWTNHIAALTTIKSRLAFIHQVLQANTETYQRYAASNPAFQQVYTQYTTVEMPATLPSAPPKGSSPSPTVNASDDALKDATLASVLDENGKLEKQVTKLKLQLQSATAGNRPRTGGMDDGAAPMPSADSTDIVNGLLQQIEDLERKLKEKPAAPQTNREIRTEQDMEFKISERIDAVAEPLREDKRKLAKQVEDLTRNHEDLIGQFKTMKSGLEKEVEGQTKLYQDLVSDLGGINAVKSVPEKLKRLGTISEELRKTQAAVEPLSKQIAALTGEKQQLVRDHKKEMLDLQNQLSAAQSHTKMWEERYTSLNKTHEGTEKTNVESKEEVVKIPKEFTDEADTLNKGLQAENKDLKNKVEEQQKQIEILTKQLASNVKLQD